MAEIPSIDVAALELVTSLSRPNLRKGDTYWCYVPRARVLTLARLLEEKYPGAIESVYDEREKEGAQ